MSDNRQFSCSKGNNRPNQGGCGNNNVMPSQYCQEFSKPPWTRPEEDSARYNQYAENQQRVNEMKAQQDNEYGMQYMARQNAGQANDECSNIPDPCSPEQGVSQNKSKPKTKKRPIKPFATTDQLRNKIFGYIENQPNLAPLTPFRGYRDDLVRQQLCCSDELVTNPPDPCPPEDPCEEWNPEQKDSSCTCPTLEPSPSCPPSNPTSGRSSASRCGRNPCSTKKKCKKVDEPKKNCESDELADILEYCKQIKGETAAMYSEGNATSQAPTYGSFSAAISPFNAPAPSTPGSSAGATKERYEPDPELRCEEEELSDEFDAEDYKDHEMFGGPDAVPRRTLNEEMKMYRLHIANIRKRYFGEMMKNIDDLDTITPDIAAAMVYSEELGLKIKSAPQTAYDYLYPEAPSQPMLNIGHVTESAPKGIDDIVVPLAPPMMLTAAEFPGLEDPAMLDHPRILQVMPSMNLVEEPKATDTMPANDICELVTGTTHVNMMSLLFPEYEGMEAIDDEEDEDEQRFNIKLNASIPAHFTQMQIRGSEPPSWFPGYYVALPSKPDVMIERKYGNILEKVWEEVQPEFVRPSGGAAIIGS